MAAGVLWPAAGHNSVMQLNMKSSVGSPSSDRAPLEMTSHIQAVVSIVSATLANRLRLVRVVISNHLSNKCSITRPFRPVNRPTGECPTFHWIILIF